MTLIPPGTHRYNPECNCRECVAWRSRKVVVVQPSQQLVRPRNNDPFHEQFAEAHRFITDTRFFGKTAHEDALTYIHAARREYYAGRTKFPIGEPQRIDRDAERLVKLADGKLYGTAMKMAERPNKPANGRELNAHLLDTL